MRVAHRLDVSAAPALAGGGTLNGRLLPSVLACLRLALSIAEFGGMSGLDVVAGALLRLRRLACPLFAAIAIFGLRSLTGPLLVLLAWLVLRAFLGFAIHLRALPP